MKEDVGPPPPKPPRKRRQLEQVPDLWLAIWAADDSLTPSEHRRVEEIRESRKVRQLPTIIGFTATREGLTPQQRKGVRTLLIESEPDEARHGDCVGGDEQFHEICLELGIPVVYHPPEDQRLRAFCKGALRVEKAKPFLDRNKDIVKASTKMIGAPKESREPTPARGQGTWSTIRYARARGVPIKILMPNGLELEGE